MGPAALDGEGPLMAGTFELWTDKGGDWRFNLKASNGQVIATSQGYSSKASAMKGIDSVRKNAPDAGVTEIER
ncbi:YegP family protein [Microbacterium luticocti]|uniref:YegP family protein n=1 Tax=Microbacterium luticocti TaxID=451764 RepID=UPI001FDFAC15|nr:YegP family protein [Microbacterium luticocti]